MLTATFKNGRTIDWHIGEPVPETHDDVSEIQADCDELEYIAAKFVNLPRNGSKRVHRWYGDLANVIWYNL